MGEGDKGFQLRTPVRSSSGQRGPWLKRRSRCSDICIDHSTQVLQGHGLRDDFLVGHNLEVHLNKKDGINALMPMLYIQIFFFDTGSHRAQNFCYSCLQHVSAELTGMRHCTTLLPVF